jgi:hypothetical protein
MTYLVVSLVLFGIKLILITIGADMEPIISLYGTSFRPDNWPQLYDNISDSNIPFEIVFAGPNAPNFNLPDCFKYIKTADIKPAQCVEVAVRNTTGKLIMQIADDLKLVTPKALDMLYETYINYNNENLIVSCRYMKDMEDLSYACHFYYSAQSDTPMISVAGLMSNQLYRNIGGMDKRFIAVCGDIDVILRVHAYGGSVVLSDVYINENSPEDSDNSLYTVYGPIDRAFLQSLWVINRNAPPDRRVPFEPFIDENILIESQGPKGRWI